MQVSQVSVDSNKVDIAADNSESISQCTDNKNVSFDWSLMFKVEEKLLKIAKAFCKSTDGTSKVDEKIMKIKAIVSSCGSNITVAWSSFVVPELGVTCTVLIDRVQVAVADGKSFEYAEKAAFSKLASLLSQPRLMVIREPRLVASRSETFPDDKIRSSRKFRLEWQNRKKKKKCASTPSSNPAQVTGAHVLEMSANHIEIPPSVFTPLPQMMRIPFSFNFRGSTSKNGDGECFPIKTVSQKEYEESESTTKAFVKLQSKPSALQISELVIIRQQDSTEQTSADILNSSAKLCNKALYFSEGLLSNGLFQCSINVDNRVIGEGIAGSAQEAHSAAVEAALSECCVILVKNMRTALARNVITLEQILTNHVQMNIVPESNVGCKLLRKMGWSGGGLRQDSIIDPVIPVGRVKPTDKSGLGFRKNVSNPRKVLRNLFTEYLRSEQLEDLIFSPDLSQKVQVLVQKEATLLDLEVSYCDSGQQSKQYIVVNRHRSIAQLVKHVRAHGGETQRHVLTEAKGVTEHSLKPLRNETVGCLSRSSSSTSMSDYQQFSFTEPSKSRLKRFENRPTLITTTVPPISSVASECSEKDSPDLLFSEDVSRSFTYHGIGAAGVRSRTVTKVSEIACAGTSKQSISGNTVTLSSGSSTLKYRKLMCDAVQRTGQTVKSFAPSRFVIIKSGSQTYVVPSVAILNVSAQLCGMKLVCNISKADEKVTCTITISGTNVGTGVEKTESLAMSAAADFALSYLSCVSYTLVVKDLPNCESAAITPPQLIAIGEKRMKKKNWDEETLMKRAINKVISNTKHSEDIVFGPNFTSTCQDLIRDLGTRNGLAVFRFEKGDDKFIGLKRNRKPMELVKLLKSKGGETVRFVLVKPSDEHSDLRKSAVIGSVRRKVQVAAKKD